MKGMTPSDSSPVIRALLQHALTVLNDQELTDGKLTEARSHAADWERKYFEMVEKRTAVVDRVLALPGQPETEDANNPYSEDYLRGYRHATNIAKRAVENPRAEDAAVRERS